MALAAKVSTAALAINVLFMLGFAQSSLSILDACNGWSFFGISAEECSRMAASVADQGDLEKAWAAAALTFPRGEACLFLAMGLGGLYSLLFLAKGTKDVVAVHLMHFVWAASVCATHAQDAGLLSFAPPNANVDASVAAQIVPLVVATGLQAVLYYFALVLSLAAGAPASGAGESSEEEDSAARKLKLGKTAGRISTAVLGDRTKHQKGVRPTPRVAKFRKQEEHGAKKNIKP